MVGGEHYHKILDPQLLRFGTGRVLSILNKRMTYLVNHEGLYRTPLATLGLLKFCVMMHALHI